MRRKIKYIVDKRAFLCYVSIIWVEFMKMKII